MKKEFYILPVECNNCGKVFDLYSELLQKKEPTRFEIVTNSVEDTDNLCADCRKMSVVQNITS